MRRLKLMPDYYSHPLWDLDEPGDVDPGMLPLSEELRARLRAWAEEYDATLNQEYPPGSGFVDAKAEQSFEEEGRRLWLLVSKELGAAYSVSYYSVTRNTLLPPAPVAYRSAVP